MAEDTSGLVLAGVGGQGVILAGMIVADALVRAGHEVKQSEVHGMAQRGGSVFSHIRWGTSVESPLVPLGSAEVLGAFEWAEALRWVTYVREGGAVVADLRAIVPPGACNNRRAWSTTYPEVRPEVFADRRIETRIVDAAAAADALGNVRAAGSVILGSVASYCGIDICYWEAAIEHLVPAGTEEVNLAAFRVGFEVDDAQAPPAAPAPQGFAGPHLIDIRQEWCKGCDICSRACPEYCLAIDKSARLIVVDPEACTGCRLCELLCPDFAIAIRPPNAAVVGAP